MSQPPSQQAKRRRLNNAASALSRPFKSPLPRSAQQKESANSDAAAAIQTGLISQQESPAHRHEPAIPNTSSSPSPNIKTSSQPRHPTHSLESPEIPALRRKRLALQSKLTSLRSELDTAQQALRIESSARDDELRALKLKWRGISQKAADELFETAKDKVERLGGVAVWMERERLRVKRMQMWEEDDFYHGSGDGGDNNGEREERYDDDVDENDDGSGLKEDGEEEANIYYGHDAKESEHRARNYWL
ncbi:DNA repair protein Dds20/Mei5, putative [Talaromyces marneffei ATCC 18224]|uniref:DNA repair protein Dds20/Mei5, putative n=1 Tax=Talaromyces marneffei (strain ATCC 18224 / CBS 334.59 / QM 7333) TaxID=441960 RepID=B6QAY0_TALMQ|nr:DNA repair protein Dds20/Mei5, putative [Talaromyces marneffei ATCC 18224]